MMWRVEFFGYWFVSCSNEFKGNTIYIHGVDRLISHSNLFDLKFLPFFRYPAVYIHSFGSLLYRLFTY